MLEININFIFNNTVVTSHFHGRKIKKYARHSTHSTHNFFSNGPGKTHKGKTSQREREFYYQEIYNKTQKFSDQLIST